jgi:hypothetical protein
MMEGYGKAVSFSEDEQSVFQIIKFSLKIKSQLPVLPSFSCRDLSVFWGQARGQLTDQEYIYHLRFLQLLSGIQVSQSNFEALEQLITRRYRRQVRPNEI